MYFLCIILCTFAMQRVTAFRIWIEIYERFKHKWSTLFRESKRRKIVFPFSITLSARRRSFFSKRHGGAAKELIALSTGVSKIRKKQERRQRIDMIHHTPSINPVISFSCSQTDLQAASSRGFKRSMRSKRVLLPRNQIRIFAPERKEKLVRHSHDFL